MGRSRKKQTRLAFQPLSSTSPQSAGLPQQVRDRAAAVRLDSSPLSTSSIGTPKALPTPTKSFSELRSQPLVPDWQGDTSDEEEAPVRSSKRSRNLGSSQKIFSQGRHKASPKDVESSSSSDAEKRPAKKSKKTKSKKDKSTKRKTRSSGLASDRVEPLDLEDDSPRELRSSTKSHKQQYIDLSDEEMALAQPAILPDIGEAETSGDESVVSSQVRRQRANASLNGKEQKEDDADTDTPNQPVKRAKHQIVDSSDEEEDDIVSPLKRKSTRAITISDGGNDDSEDAVSPVTRTRKDKPSQIASKRRRGPTTSESDRSEDSDEDESAPKKRRRLIGRPSNKRSKQKQNELDDDLENLRSSPPPVVASSTKKSAAQEALARLREQRARGKTRTSPSVDIVEDESEPNEQEGLLDDDAADMFLEDEGDEGFVIEDENDPIGAPDLPLEFSSFNRMKAKDLFKFVVEWMVQKKINPAFSMDDEVYTLAFRKLDDDVKGLASSKFTSSAWNADFITALQARPEIIESHATNGMLDFKNCGACNRTNHPATFQVMFSGKPYHPDTLEEVENAADDSDEESSGPDDSDDSTSSGDEDGKRTTYDYKGRVVLPSSKSFYLGKFCMDNARMAHTLAHWRMHLYDWIIDYLRNEGELTTEKVVARDNMKTKKRRKYANKLVDRMETSGEIKRLYRDFQNEVNTARESKRQAMEEGSLSWEWLTHTWKAIAASLTLNIGSTHTTRELFGGPLMYLDTLDFQEPPPI